MDSGSPALAQAPVRSTMSDRIYLHLDGVDGEVTETDHTGDLAPVSFSWGATALPQTGFKDLHIVMRADKAFPVLMRKAAMKDRIANAQLVMRNPLGQDYMKWALKDLSISAFQIDATAGQGKPVVTFDLRIGRIDVEYRSQLYNGGLSPAVKSGWDAKGGG